MIILGPTGAYPNLASARRLCKRLEENDGIICTEHYSPYAHATPQLAELASLSHMVEAHRKEILVYAGTENFGAEGHKVLVICAPTLPHDFEEKYRGFRVIGN